MCPPKMLPSALVSRGIMISRIAGFRASDMVDSLLVSSRLYGEIGMLPMYPRKRGWKTG
jgi:hypothetical protein